MIAALELREVTLAATLGGQARDAGLEDQPHLEPAQDRVEAELGDPEAAVGVRVHEALGAQAPQRLADGGAGDPEAPGELDLPEPLARGDVTVEDEAADALVREVHDAVDLKHEPQSNAYIIRAQALTGLTGMDTLCAMPAAETQRRVRVEHAGEPVWGRIEGDAIVLDNGARIAEASARYLAPATPAKIIAVHLTYRSRVEEYAARIPPQPSYFMKPPTTLNGHRGVGPPPRGHALPQLRGRARGRDRRRR